MITGLLLKIKLMQMVKDYRKEMKRQAVAASTFLLDTAAIGTFSMSASWFVMPS